MKDYYSLGRQFNYVRFIKQPIESNKEGYLEAICRINNSNQPVVDYLEILNNLQVGAYQEILDRINLILDSLTKINHNNNNNKQDCLELGLDSGSLRALELVDYLVVGNSNSNSLNSKILYSVEVQLKLINLLVIVLNKHQLQDNRHKRVYLEVSSKRSQLDKDFSLIFRIRINRSNKVCLEGLPLDNNSLSSNNHSNNSKDYLILDNLLNNNSNNLLNNNSHNNSKLDYLDNRNQLQAVQEIHRLNNNRNYNLDYHNNLHYRLMVSDSLKFNNQANKNKLVLRYSFRKWIGQIIIKIFLAQELEAIHLFNNKLIQQNLRMFKNTLIFSNINKNTIHLVMAIQVRIFFLRNQCKHLNLKNQKLKVNQNWKIQRILNKLQIYYEYKIVMMILN